MVWVRTVVTAPKLAAQNLDKPALVGEHELLDLYRAETSGGVWTETGNTSDADQAATGYPVARAYDGFAQYALHTKPNAAAAIWYLAFDCSAAPITFDTMALFSHVDNLAHTITVEVANDAVFTANLATILTLDSAGYGPGVGTVAARSVHAKLSNSPPSVYQFNNVPYIRFGFAPKTGTLTPEVSEIRVGVKRQLFAHPDIPVNNLAERSEVNSIRTKSGLTERQRIYRGQAFRSTVIATGGADDLDPLTRWWADSDHAGRSFLWIETPGTAPAGYVMTYDGDSADFNPSLEGHVLRRLTLPMAECAPFRSQD